MGDGSRRAQQAIDEGATTLVSFGGDGTHSEVADGIVRSGRGAEVSLGILHAGTGGDFRKMLQRSDELEGACDVIRNSKAERSTRAGSNTRSTAARTRGRPPGGIF